MNRLTVTRAAIQLGERLTAYAKQLHVTGLTNLLTSKHTAWQRAKADAVIADEVAELAYDRASDFREAYANAVIAVDAELDSLIVEQRT